VSELCGVVQQDFQSVGSGRCIIHRQGFATYALADTSQSVWNEAVLGLRREDIVIDGVAELSRDAEECRLVGAISRGSGIG
jgi:hypothetical protein